MPPALAIVADDLTGAADTGVAFLSPGLSAVVSWPRVGPVGTLDIDRAWSSPAPDVIAVNTRSRAAGVAQAGAVTRQVVTALREAEVAALYKKIDSTLRGHVGAEVRAAMDAWHPGSLAVVAPAFPGTGRTTVDGQQRLDGRPVSGRAFVPALLEQAGLSTRCAGLTSVRSAAFESALHEYRDQGVRALVCDAETDDDLRCIARAGGRLGSHVVWVGSGGLARAIAADLPGADRPARGALKVSGPILTLVGSTSAIARAQADDMAAAGVRRILVPMEALAAESVPDDAGVARQVEAHLRAGEDILVVLDADGCVRSEDDPRLTTRLGQLLRNCAASVGGLVVTGGDTAVGVLDAWGVTALRLVAEFDPGVVLSETVGAPAISVVTKAGSFGDRGTLTRARQRLAT